MAEYRVVLIHHEDGTSRQISQTNKIYSLRAAFYRRLKQTEDLREDGLLRPNGHEFITAHIQDARGRLF